MDLTDVPKPEIPPPDADRDAFTLAYLAAHEAECPACGYNVHALREPRCPECGGHLVVKVVAAVSGYSRAWNVLLMSTGVACGIGLLVGAVILHEGYPQENDLRVILGFFLCNIPLLSLTVMARRLFLRNARVTQWIAAILHALLTLGMLAWFLTRIAE